MAHQDRNLIVARLEAIQDVCAGQRYRHNKTGGQYLVEGLVVLEATDELAVAYHAVDHPTPTWIRPYQDFVAVVDGVPRFSLLS